MAPPSPTNIKTMTRQHTWFRIPLIYSLAARPQALHESLHVIHVHVSLHAGKFTCTQGFLLQGGWEEFPPLAKNFIILPTWKYTPTSRLPPN